MGNTSGYKKDNNIVIPAYKGATEFKYVTAISQ